MTEAEAYEVALQYMTFAHDLGEAAHDRIQFWIGTSYVLLIAAYAAPHRLNLGITTLLMALYITFSLFTYTIIRFDSETAYAAMRDAVAVMQNNSIQIESVSEKMRAQTDEQLRHLEDLSMLFAPGLFLGVMGFVVFVTLKNWKNRKANTYSASE
jgi:hypothetical protein